jgi:rsbT co-antagonist protein RsbR
VTTASSTWGQGLRHAAFSKLVSEVSRAKTLDEIGEVLAKDIKYIVDALTWRIMYVDPNAQIVYECTRGRARFWRAADDAVCRFALEILEQNLPVQMSPAQVSAEPALADSVFQARSDAELLAMPIASANARLCVLFGGQESTPYTSIDFQFARLIGENVATRIEHFLLVEQLQAQAARLEQTIATVRAQREELLELFAPIIEVWDGIAVLPLVGVLDRERVDKVTQAVLTSIQRCGTRELLIDLTGALNPDRLGFLQIIAAARLLGTRCAVVGVSPRMALTLIEHEGPLEGIETHASLRAGLRSALRRLQSPVS